MEEGEEVVTFEMETFSTSGAFGLLEEASKGGDVSEEKLERYKTMFAQMFQELKRTKDSDESLETQLGQLEKQLAEEKLKMESGRGIGEEGESTTLSSLREDMQQAKAEVALGLEREQVLLLEMNELQRQRDRLKLSVEALDIEKAKEIEPQVRECGCRSRRSRRSETRSSARGMRPGRACGRSTPRSRSWRTA